VKELLAIMLDGNVMSAPQIREPILNGQCKIDLGGNLDRQSQLKEAKDLTLVLPDKTLVGNVISEIKSVSKLILQVELTDIYEDSYTFNVKYHSEEKTLTDNEVEEIRNKVLSSLKSKFGITIKE